MQQSNDNPESTSTSPFDPVTSSSSSKRVENTSLTCEEVLSDPLWAVRFVVPLSCAKERNKRIKDRWTEGSLICANWQEKKSKTCMDSLKALIENTPLENILSQLIRGGDFNEVAILARKNPENIINMPEKKVGENAALYPIHIAMATGSWVPIDILITAGIKGDLLNIIDPMGSYPIHYAALQSECRFKALLKGGADPNLKDAAGYTAWDLNIERRQNDEAAIEKATRALREKRRQKQNDLYFQDLYRDVLQKMCEESSQQAERETEKPKLD